MKVYMNDNICLPYYVYPINLNLIYNLLVFLWTVLYKYTTQDHSPHENQVLNNYLIEDSKCGQIYENSQNSIKFELHAIIK